MLTAGLLCAQCNTSLDGLFSSFCLAVSSCSPGPSSKHLSFFEFSKHAEAFFPSGPLAVIFLWPGIPIFQFPHPSYIPPVRDAFFTPQLEESPPPHPIFLSSKTYCFYPLNTFKVFVFVFCVQYFDYNMPRHASLHCLDFPSFLDLRVYGLWFCFY